MKPEAVYNCGIARTFSLTKSTTTLTRSFGLRWATWRSTRPSPRFCTNMEVYGKGQQHFMHFHKDNSTSCKVWRPISQATEKRYFACSHKQLALMFKTRVVLHSFLIQFPETRQEVLCFVCAQSTVAWRQTLRHSECLFSHILCRKWILFLHWRCPSFPVSTQLKTLPVSFSAIFTQRFRSGNGTNCQEQLVNTSINVSFSGRNRSSGTSVAGMVTSGSKLLLFLSWHSRIPYSGHWNKESILPVSRTAQTHQLSSSLH